MTLFGSTVCFQTQQVTTMPSTVREDRSIRAGATDAIHPRHAWMLGLVVDDDGSFVAPPAAAGPHHGMVNTARPVDGPACTCPDFCELDHLVD